MGPSADGAPTPEHPAPASRSARCIVLHPLPDSRSGLCALCWKGIGNNYFMLKGGNEGPR